MPIITLPDGSQKTFDTPVSVAQVAKSIFIVRIKNRIFAIPFGYGWHCLNNGVFEERFGLKVAINSMNNNRGQNLYDILLKIIRKEPFKLS